MQVVRTPHRSTYVTQYWWCVIPENMNKASSCLLVILVIRPANRAVFFQRVITHKSFCLHESDRSETEPAVWPESIFLCTYPKSLLQSKGNDMLANYAYDLVGNCVLFFACFGAGASLIQMFQIGNLRRRVESLEGKLKSLEDA